jgi:hypothetical protein
MKHLRTACISATIILGVILLCNRAEAVVIEPVLTDAEKNLHQLGDISTLTIAQLARPPFSFGMGGDFIFSGTFSDSGWNLAIDGHFSQISTHLSFAGSFNPVAETGVYSTLQPGSFVDDSLVSSRGSYQFTNTDDGAISTTQGTLLVGTTLIALNAVDPITCIVRPDGSVVCISRTCIPDEPPGSGDFCIIDRAGPPNQLEVMSENSNFIDFIGDVNVDVGTVTGTITVTATPEPSSLAVVLSGICFLLFLMRPRRPLATTATAEM